MVAKNCTPASSLIIIVIAFAVLVSTSAAFASSPVEQVLYSLQGTGNTGWEPHGGLVADKAGNLYGMTAWGAAAFGGAVFEVSPPATQGGAWTGTVIYTFLGGDNDGSQPYGSLIIDKKGNLFGATHAGGPNNTGTVFELSPPATQGGAWTETILFIFPADDSEGNWPMGKLAVDAAGSLYGTTWFGGTGTTCPGGGCGVAFQLVPPASQGAPWTMNVIHNFGSFTGDGYFPGVGLIARGGVIYGTTQDGGAKNCGTVFELAPSNGAWTETILHDFTVTEGCSFHAGLIVDSAGNFYGTGYSGGSSNAGVVFELSPPAVNGDPWQETTLYSFTGHYDGAGPVGGVVRDGAGNLYGTTSGGGLNNIHSRNNGVVFRLSPPTVAGGAWKEAVMHPFAGASSGDGASPFGDLLLFKGTLYGTTGGGGSPGPGTVFSVVP